MRENVHDEVMVGDFIICLLAFFKISIYLFICLFIIIIIIIFKKEGSRKGSRRGSKKGSKRGVQKGESTFCLHPSCYSRIPIIRVPR